MAPSLVPLKLRAGDRYDGQLLLFNDGYESVTVRAYPQKYLVFPDGGIKYVAVPASDRDEPVNWIRLEWSETPMRPMERRNFTFSIEVPRETRLAGDSYAVIFFEAAASAAASRAEPVALSARVGAVLFLTIGDKVPPVVTWTSVWDAAGKVGSPGTTALASWWTRLRRLWLALAHSGTRSVPWITEGRPLDVAAPLRNAGNVHVTPVITAVIRGPGGLEEERLVERDEAILLPGRPRLYQVAWKRTPVFGLRRVDLEVNYGGPEPLRRSEWVVLFPWRTLFSLALILWAGQMVFAPREVVDDASAPERGPGS